MASRRCRVYAGQTMYTIKRAAELTGIGLASLRAWERRYGVVPPSRTESRYRLYSDNDVRALSIMAALVDCLPEAALRQDPGVDPLTELAQFLERAR